MAAICRLGDISTGHGSFPPRVNDSGSPNVFVNSMPIHRLGDHWITHCDSHSCHDGVDASGSPSVFANGRVVARIGDSISCGDMIAQGSQNVFAG